MSFPVPVNSATASEQSQTTNENLLHDDFSVRGIALVFFISVTIISGVAGVFRIITNHVEVPAVSASDIETVDPEFILYTSAGAEPIIIPGEKLLPIENPEYTFWEKISDQFQIFELSAAEASSSDSTLTDTSNTRENQEKISPLLRVGLFYTSSAEQFSSPSGYQVFAGDTLVLTSTGEYPVKLWYDRAQKKYQFHYQEVQQSYDQPLRIQALASGVMTIDSYRHPPAWNKYLPDNQFRGSLEFYFATSTGRTWVINELPIEDYLKGLGETRSTDNFEYLKVMTIVGRSYALWHRNDNFKHGHEGFAVDAYFDQVYQGYANELRNPELVRAVADTFGEVVMYEDEIALTPYFARSNGYTKDWSEVWYRDPYPWIKGVVVPVEQGFSQLGHGVGLSAIGAMLMAEQGENYENIIKFFYTNVSVGSWY